MTRDVFARLSDEVQAIYVELGNLAGRDPIRDRELVGRIKATKAILEIDYSDVYEGDA